MYIEILSEREINYLKRRSIILSESNSQNLYEVKLFKDIKDVLSKKFKGSISKLKEILSQAKVKITDFIKFIAKNIKNIKNIRIVNVEEIKIYFSKVVEKIIDKNKNESKKISLSNILFEGDTHIEQIVNYSPKFKLDLENIQANKESLDKFEKDIKKAAKEDKKFNFANNLMQTLRNYEKPVKFLLTITMVASFASSAMSFSDKSSDKDVVKDTPSIVFVNSGTGDIKPSLPTDFSDINFDKQADTDTQSPIEINLDRYQYFNAQSESEFLKLILTKKPSQFMKKSHVDKVFKAVVKAKREITEIHKIDDITYVFANGFLHNSDKIADLVFEHGDIDVSDLKKKKGRARFYAKQIANLFADNSAAAFVKPRLFGKKQIVFIDVDALATNEKESSISYDDLAESIEHEIGHIKSELKADPLSLLEFLNQEDKVDFYGFAASMMDQAFEGKEGYDCFFVKKSLLKFMKNNYGEESSRYKYSFNKTKNYKKTFKKILSKLTKAEQEKVLDHVIISLKIGIASNLITITDEKGKEIFNINKNNIENINIIPINNSTLETASQLLERRQNADGYFFNEEERSENITSALKHVKLKDLKSFVKKFTDSNFIEDSIKNKKNITMEDINAFFANLGFEQDEIWRLMACSGFGMEKNKKGEQYFIPMSSLGNEYELMHQRFWKNSKQMIQKNAHAIYKNKNSHDHDHDHKHESFVRLKQEVYERILIENAIGKRYEV